MIRRRFSLVAVVLVFSVLIVAPLALAKTIEVPKDFQTIQLAINAAEAGDVILVAAGTYKENLTIKKSIELRGAGPDTIVDGSAGRARKLPTIWVQRTRDVIIRNLKITGGRRGIQVDRSSNVTIVGNVIQGNRRQGILITENSQGAQIVDNHILDTEPDEGDVLGNGIILNGDRNARVVGNLISRSAYSGIRFLSAIAQIENNTIEQNRVYGIEIWPNWVETPDVPSEATIVNNVLKGNMRSGIFITEESLAQLTGNQILDTALDRDKQHGHGLWITDGARAVLENNTITNSLGHGLFIESGRVELRANTVTASTGCGLRVEDGAWLALTATTLTLSENKESACGTAKALRSASTTSSSLSLEPGETTTPLVLGPGESVTLPFVVAHPGRLKVQAITLTQDASLVLALFGPGQETPYARTQKPSPLSLTLDVPAETIALGTRWRAVVQNRGLSNALVITQISAPVRLGSCQDITNEFSIQIDNSFDAPPFSEPQCNILYSSLRAVPEGMRRTVTSITNNPSDPEVAGNYIGGGVINIFGPMLRRMFSFVFIHEMGHAVQDRFVSGVQNQRWRELHRRSGRDLDNFVSDYARTNDHEDFAETFATYIDDALGLLKIARERAAKGKPILLEKFKFMAELFRQLGSDNTISTFIYAVRLKTDDERTRLTVRRIQVSFDANGLPTIPTVIEWEEF